MVRRKKVSFIARTPSGRRKRITFYATPKIVRRKKRLRKPYPWYRI